MKENLFSEVMKHIESKDVVQPKNEADCENNKHIENVLDDFLS